MEKKAFTFLFITIFIDFLSFGIVFPLLPYYAKSFGATSLEIGLLVSVFSFMQFLFSPMWGRISDRVGRKPIILLSLLGTSFSLLGLALSTDIIWLFISRAMAGVFTAASLPTTYAYVADHTKEKERVEKFGMLGAAWGLGFIFGPALSGLLSSYSFQTPLFVAATIALLNFVFTKTFLPESKKNNSKLQIQKEGFLNVTGVMLHLKSEVGLLFIVFSVAAITLSSLEVAFPLYTERKFNFNETNIGYFFSLIGIVVGITQGLVVGKLVKMVGEYKTVIIAHANMMAGYLLMAFSPNIMILSLSGIILAIGIALNEPSLVSIISNRSKEAQGTTLGATWSFDSLARILGPALGGYLFYRFSTITPFIVNCLLLIVSSFLFRSFYLKNK